MMDEDKLMVEEIEKNNTFVRSKDNTSVVKKGVIRGTKKLDPSSQSTSLWTRLKKEFFKHVSVKCSKKLERNIPQAMKESASVDTTKYWQFYKCHGHLSSESDNLKGSNEYLIKKGKLGRYTKEDNLRGETRDTRTLYESLCEECVLLARVIPV